MMIALTGCGGQPVGSDGWNQAYMITMGGGPISPLTLHLDWAAAGTTLTDLGYGTLGSDAQKIDAAERAGDDQGMASATTQFLLDVSHTNLNTSP